MKKKKIPKPDLKSQAYITVTLDKGFDVDSFRMVRTFSMLIQPVIETKDTIELKPNDGFIVQFNYDDKKGLPIEGICKCLEGMADKIRKHYK